MYQTTEKIVREEKNIFHECISSLCIQVASISFRRDSNILLTIISSTKVIICDTLYNLNLTLQHYGNLHFIFSKLKQ